MADRNEGHPDGVLRPPGEGEGCRYIGAWPGSGRSPGRWCLRSLADLLLPVRCAGCGEPDVSLCSRCREHLGTLPRRHHHGVAALGCPVWYGSDYAGVTARVLRAWKEQGRADLTEPLSLVLADMLRQVLGAGWPDPGEGRFRPGPARELGAVGGPPVVLVPVPSRGASRRDRGADLVGETVRRAADLHRRSGGRPVRVASVLTLGRPVRDQSGLTAAQRHRNLSGAMRVRRGRDGDVTAQTCLVVDDILTTAATVGEAVRVLTGAGADVIAVATLSATPRRSQVTHTPLMLPRAR
jgi:predicted amidophosphoribosyltransferase